MENLEELIPLLTTIEPDDYKEQLRGSLNEHMTIINHHLQNFKNFIQNNEFTIFTMDQILTRIEYTGKNYGYTRLIDVGLAYAGMGYYVVLSWDRTKHKYFFRFDGGSNGIDRQINEKFFLTKLNLNDEKYKDKLLDCDKVIEIVNNGISKEMLVRAE